MRGVKNDQGKPRTDLLPLRGLMSVARVMGHGAQKYGPCNWERGIEMWRLFGAALRHLFLWRIRRGEPDRESGLSHLAHACANILMLPHYEELGADAFSRWGEMQGEKDE